MRVISGKFKGIKLVSPRGEVRPTTDLVKGSLFSMLDSKGLLRDAKCLDIFCGSGALGIEALSRGAMSCVFADIDTENVYANLNKLKIDSRVICAGYEKALRLLKDCEFDIVFCDPPYKTDFAERTYRILIKYGMIGKGGVVVLEYASENDLINIPKCRIIDVRKFGVSKFAIVGGESEGDICGDV